jgi:hypothetical protein
VSTVYNVRCETDGEDGPKLQRKPGGAGLLDSDAWNAWLIDHEWHELVLVHE